MDSCGGLSTSMSIFQVHYVFLTMNMEIDTTSVLKKDSMNILKRMIEVCMYICLNHFKVFSMKNESSRIIFIVIFILYIIHVCIHLESYESLYNHIVKNFYL